MSRPVVTLVAARKTYLNTQRMICRFIQLHRFQKKKTEIWLKVNSFQMNSNEFNKYFFFSLRHHMAHMGIEFMGILLLFQKRQDVHSFL